MPVLTQERLKEVLHYNPMTGIFTRKITLSSNAAKGNIAGCSTPEGYKQIGIDGKLYKAHRLAWLYYYGYFPEHVIDHRDRIKHHNWILNLREVSTQCNLRNTGNPKDNTSGVKGVCWHKQSQKWMASIVVNRKYKYLGIFKSFDEAVCARLAGEQCLNWSNCDSSSPAYLHVKKLQEDYNGKIGR